FPVKISATGVTGGRADERGLRRVKLFRSCSADPSSATPGESYNGESILTSKRRSNRANGRRYNALAKERRFGSDRLYLAEDCCLT
ncbi:hypothetical protein K0M31_007365, partial [Melipona bicolor]